MNESHIRNVIEAALLAAGKPLQPAELVELFDEGTRPQLQDIHTALTALMDEYSHRGIEIKETAAGFRIQVRRELANEVSRLWPERPAKYSRAMLETLALIAYRQPITRAEIEAVRGVAVNPNILKTVIERNWVRVVGHRDVPGRPELLGTTRDFLDYFGLKSLDELPPLAELKAIGDIKVQFDLPDPGPLGLVEEGGSGAADVAGAVGAAGAAADAGVDAGVNTAAADAAGAVADGREADGGVEEVGGDAPVASAESDVLESDQAGSDATGSDAAEGDAAEGDAGEDDAGEDEVDAVANDAGEHEAVTATAAAADGDAANVEANAVAADGAADVEANAVAAGGAADVEPPTAEPKSRAAPDTALYEAEEFVASLDADLAAGDDDGSDDDELSAAGPGSSELVAGPRDFDS